MKRRLYEDIENVSLYLVPSVLKFPPLEDERKLIAFAGIPPLYLKFRSSRVLSGLFPRVVLRFAFALNVKMVSSGRQVGLYDWEWTFTNFNFSCSVSDRNLFQDPH